ncbi:hypothetical protein ACJOV8_012530 [Formosa sp. 3Alg 14/1]|uniref:hypothetical protein n=1 Tax=unclassified Formosa TaxID=2644710 RepID=UPI0039BDF324
MTIGLIITGVGFLIFLIDNNIAPTNQLWTLIFLFFIVGFIPIGFSYVFQFFDYENIDVSNKEYLNIGDESITLNYKKEILLSDIEELNIVINAYYNQRINLSYRTPTEHKSLGVNNEIQIKTKYDAIKFYFKLEDEGHKNKLEDVLYSIITNGKLENLDSKKAIKLIPDRFRNSEKYKSYVISQIVSKRINCTEGLLLHGYKTYEEAKDLREKYCG